MKGLSPQNVPGITHLNFHCLHAFSQTNILSFRVVCAKPISKALHESPQGFLTEDVTSSSAHVALCDEWCVPTSKIQRLLRVVLGQTVAQILKDNKRVIVSFEEPISMVQMVRVDVLEGPYGLPVELTASF